MLFADLIHKPCCRLLFAVIYCEELSNAGYEPHMFKYSFSFCWLMSEKKLVFSGLLPCWRLGMSSLFGPSAVTDELSPQ